MSLPTGNCTITVHPIVVYHADSRILLKLSKDCGSLREMKRKNRVIDGRTVILANKHLFAGPIRITELGGVEQKLLARRKLQKYKISNNNNNMKYWTRDIGTRSVFDECFWTCVCVGLVHGWQSKRVVSIIKYAIRAYRNSFLLLQRNATVSRTIR